MIKFIVGFIFIVVIILWILAFHREIKYCEELEKRLNALKNPNGDRHDRYNRAKRIKWYIVRNRRTFEDIKHIKKILKDKEKEGE